MGELEQADKLFFARLKDLSVLSREKPRFSSFLNEREAALARGYLSRSKLCNCMFYGGRENAGRVMLGAFPDFISPEENHFPITMMTSRYPETASLTHRDFLGALMGLGLTGESIGDILVSPGRCDFFVQNPVVQVILNELLKVGSFGVKTAVGVPGDFVVLERFEEVRVTLSSTRVDALVGALAKISREKASEFIKAGMVQHNFFEAASNSKQFKTGDTISIKGHGKYIVDKVGSPTKKGRLPVFCRKYL